MALSTTELELQSTEYLPARDVMTSMCLGQLIPHRGVDDGHMTDGNDGNEFEGGILNGANVEDVVTDIDAEEIQVPLVNVLLEDFNSTLDLGTANDDEISQIED